VYGRHPSVIKIQAVYLCVEIVQILRSTLIFPSLMLWLASLHYLKPYLQVQLLFKLNLTPKIVNFIYGKNKYLKKK